jgi:hypothetical protein
MKALNGQEIKDIPMSLFKLAADMMKLSIPATMDHFLGPDEWAIFQKRLGDGLPYSQIAREMFDTERHCRQIVKKACQRVYKEAWEIQHGRE